MELKDVLKKRRTIRDFQNKEISMDIIDYAIVNGFKAPTYNHLREWDFVILNQLESKLMLIESENLNKSINLKELEQQFENKDKTMKEMYLDAIPKQKKMILESPTIIVVIFRPKTRVAEAKKLNDLNCLASIWTCIENFLLSLAEHNIYGVTFIPINIETIKKNLGIPDELEIATLIPIGYMAHDAKILRQKTINISERKHYEKW